MYMYVKFRHFDDCDYLAPDKETSEVHAAAGTDGFRRAIKEEFDAWLLVPEA